MLTRERIKSVDIFLPNGELEEYIVGAETYSGKEQGICKKIKDVYLLNPAAIAVSFDDGTERIFGNLPFIYNH